MQFEPYFAFAQSLKDPNLSIESFVEGFRSPTGMAFLDNNKILVLEKEGRVRLVSNGELQPQPVLQIPVVVDPFLLFSERGLLGIAVMNNNSCASSISSQGANSYSTIFLYYTESGRGEELRNRVYKYCWDGQTLNNPTLLVDLPAIPGPNHNGGKLMVGPDNYLYGV